MIFGAHMPTKGGVHNALKEGKRIGCEVVQLFVKNNMQWFAKPYPPEALSLYANEAANDHFGCVFGHTGYLINLGAPTGPNRKNSIKSLVQEIELATSLGLPFLVLHPGSHLGKGETRGLRHIIDGLNEVFSTTAGSPVRIALENTAGQGSSLGSQLSHLSAIFEGVERPERLGVCFDTAHFFEAGHPIHTPEGWEKTMAEADDLIGLDQVLAFHVNDSKTPFGSKVDRHAGIGEGHLGLEAFRHIVNDPRFEKTPGCLETPKSADLHEDVENLARLRGLVQAG
jgi:deoxyribonuclease IV